MKRVSDMALNVAVGGFMQENDLRGVTGQNIHKVFRQIISFAQNRNSEAFNFSGREITINLLSNAFILDRFWMDFAKETGGKLSVIAPDSEFEAENMPQGLHSVLNMNVDSSSFPISKTTMTDWISDQADIAILLWNGEESSSNSGIWTLIQACKRNGIPCVWLDTGANGKIHWALESYFEEYSADRLESYITGLFQETMDNSDEEETPKILLWPLWEKLYNHFTSKYGKQVQEAPSAVDTVLEKKNDACLMGESESISMAYLVSMFQEYDRRADSYSKKYRTSIYLRAIAPFLATLFISVGFYSETILGYFCKIQLAGWSFWSVIAGIGFFVQVLITLYIFTIAENKKVQQWHTRFADNRLIAEILRLAAHVVPFGIPVNYYSWFNRFGSKISKNIKVKNELRKILRQSGAPRLQYSTESGKALLNNLISMIDSQIVYHENSKKRYEIIVKKLKTLSSVLLTAGSVIVILRGLLQFVLAYLNIPIARNGINLLSFIKSFSNMLALIIPAWASYFSLKLSLCNFEGFMNNDIEILKDLRIIKNSAEDLKIKSQLSFENLYDLSRDISNSMISEPAIWYSQLYSAKVTRL